MPRTAGPGPLSHREKVYIRSVVLECRRNNKEVTKEDLKAAVVEANSGDLNSFTAAKQTGANDTKILCYSKPSNPYLFIPFPFKLHTARNLVPKSFCEQLFKCLQKVEQNEPKMNMSSTLEKSNAYMWFLEHEKGEFKDVCDIVNNEMKSLLFVKKGDTNNKAMLHSKTADVFAEFVEKKKIPSLVTYLRYDSAKLHGCGPHQDVDSVFATALLYLKDSDTGPLRVEKIVSIAKMTTGDVIFMNPRVVHEVPFTLREQDRLVLVFTM